MAVPRVRVLDDAGAHEIFEVVEARDGILRVRAAYRFEVGEEMRVRIEETAGEFDAVAHVRDYTDEGLAELELSDRTATRAVVSG